MADYKKIIPHILKWEGGWSDDKDDRGGATMKGVTLETYEIYCKHKGYPKPTAERLRSITQTQWEDILKTMFWDRCVADKIRSQSVANQIVDFVWCSGAWGIKFAQKVLGVDVDGVVGNGTLKAINSCDARTLFEDIKKERISFLERIAKSSPRQQKFLRGWLNRVNALKFED